MRRRFFRRPPKKVSTALRRARKVLESEGWATGSEAKVCPDGVHYCAVGAVYVATGGKTRLFDEKRGGVFDYDGRLALEAIDYLNIQVAADYYGDPADVVMWNDIQDDRRKVLRLFKRAEDAARRVGA